VLLILKQVFDRVRVLLQYEKSGYIDVNPCSIGSFVKRKTGIAPAIVNVVASAFSIQAPATVVGYQYTSGAQGMSSPNLLFKHA
jgi:hypothetical protein